MGKINNEYSNDLFLRISNLCNSRGISGGKLCADLGFSRSTLTELKKGRAATLKIEKAKLIANYFNVSVDYLLTGEKEKPAPEGGLDAATVYSLLQKMDHGELLDVMAKVTELLREKQE